MSIACPECQASAARNGFEFDGGYLHASADYSYLLHCNFCGAYYARVNYATPLQHVPRGKLWRHEAYGRLDQLAKPARSRACADPSLDSSNLLGLVLQNILSLSE